MSAICRLIPRWPKHTTRSVDFFGRSRTDWKGRRFSNLRLTRGRKTPSLLCVALPFLHSLSCFLLDSPASTWLVWRLRLWDISVVLLFKQLCSLHPVSRQIMCLSMGCAIYIARLDGVDVVIPQLLWGPCLQIWPDISRIRPIFARHRPTLAKFRSGFVPTCPDFGQLWPEISQIRPTSKICSRSLQTWPEFDQLWPEKSESGTVRNRPELDQLA